MGRHRGEQEHSAAVEFARRQAERERSLGLETEDAAARFLADVEGGGMYSALRSPTASWRDKEPTHAQRSLLRQLGVNPFAVSTRGEAADKIARLKAGAAK